MTLLRRPDTNSKGKRLATIFRAEVETKVNTRRSGSRKTCDRKDGDGRLATPSSFKLRPSMAEGELSRPIHKGFRPEVFGIGDHLTAVVEHVNRRGTLDIVERIGIGVSI